MSRVFTVTTVLTDEKTGEQIATKVARVHETDIPAGIYLCEMKRRELFRDIDSFLTEAVDA